MGYSNNKVSAPVSINDVQRALGSSINDLGGLCRLNHINRWAKYKPVKLASVDTVAGQWDSTNMTWLSSASWWHGDRTPETNYARECGFLIPKVDYESEYRRPVYYYDDREAINIFTAPSNVPTGVWQYEQRSIYRLTDFAEYSHVNPVKPMYATFPTSPVRVTADTTGFTVQVHLNNLSQSDEAIFANDMEELAGSQFCVKMTVLRYENNVLVNTKTYEAAGGIMTANSTHLSATFMKKLLMNSASDSIHTDIISLQPYLRKGMRLLSIGCEQVQQSVLQANFVTSAYKMRYMVGGLTNTLAWHGSLFGASYSQNYAGKSLRPVVDDVVTSLTTGQIITMGGLFVKTIIEDIYNSGALSGQYTVNVYVEDLNEGDINKCIIPKTRILSFHTGTGSALLQGYGYRGASDQPESVGNIALEFADSVNAQSSEWDMSVINAIPILEPFGTDEVWPAGTPLNPYNDVVAKFRVIAEVVPTELQCFDVANNGTGTYKLTDAAHSQYEMSYWTQGYCFEVIEDPTSSTGYSVIEDRQICGSVISLDSDEVDEDYGTSAWMPLPVGWGSPTSIYQTE